MGPPPPTLRVVIRIMQHPPVLPQVRAQQQLHAAARRRRKVMQQARCCVLCKVAHRAAQPKQAQRGSGVPAPDFCHAGQVLGLDQLQAVRAEAGAVALQVGPTLVERLCSKRGRRA